MSAKILSALAAVLLAGAVTATAFAAADHDHGNRDRTGSIDNPNHCKVVERKPGEDNGNLSTSVTAGNGQVSAQSSGGHGVTVHSGNGGVSSSVSSTTGSGNGTTTVTTSNGDCIIYVNPGEKKED